jgi:prephenate dehydrogenase
VKVGIIGTGLIGSSIGLACRERGDTVLGFDWDTLTLKFAVRTGVIDAAARRYEIYETCDAVVIALPLGATIQEVRDLREREFRPDQFVIDVASVKTGVEEAGRDIEAFVPTHPMAGSEKGGPGAARADLFEGRWWCYVSTRDERRTQMARAFIDRLGAFPCGVDAHEHDRIAALTSHMPQLVAYAFKQCIDGFVSSAEAGTVNALCGPVAQELLRIAASSHHMWDPIFEANASAIEEALEQLKRALDDRRLSG